MVIKSFGYGLGRPILHASATHTQDSQVRCKILLSYFYINEIDLKIVNCPWSYTVEKINLIYIKVCQ